MGCLPPSLCVCVCEGAERSGEEAQGPSAESESHSSTLKLALCF